MRPNQPSFRASAVQGKTNIGSMSKMMKKMARRT